MIFHLIWTALWWCIAWAGWIVFVFLPCCSTISGIFRLSRLELAYLAILRFLFKMNERATIKKDSRLLESKSSAFSRLGRPGENCALEAIFEKYKSSQNGKLNGEIVKRRNTDVLGQSLDLVHLGLEAIVEDDFLPRFQRQKLKAWNMMTRNKGKSRTPWWTHVIWALGLVYRYLILLPLRLFSFCSLYTGSSLVIILAVVLLPRDKSTRIAFYRYVMRVFFGWYSGCIFSPTFHNLENRPKRGLTVTNHTSPFDLFVLLNDVAYSMTGQKHGGYMGALQWLFNQLAPQIWFERTSVSDRHTLRRLLVAHSQNSENPPIVVFPEGTCSNNTATMMFKKGSFECIDVVNPIAIKYDPVFCDFYWNSLQQSPVRYLLYVLTSWQVVCDVWYLPQMRREPNESPSDFTDRVKSAISQTAKLDELPWDGHLKRSPVKEEYKMKARYMFSQRLL